ncbi:flagellar hook-basal body complex protein FliE [Burkholderia ubonensis]|uniref:flagellar hook-basal body complex protein FliE n=1 Tax=Burkholderia ubonensis TaxID=101571 RepID=UPI000755EB84|nr:flagellar hook-basal body complex protein FliE [Burkholderia ubonensis]KVT78321.1 flagellar hook-basal body complex protein FliE [Burkholderia ubonensis]KVU36593.1 flagellar hook-basal body complex protein FliE [Burkholderia ubonensis]KVV32576.1 flagellar hook-basal body complex protein FliE [Burkholderia ubonensis]
MTPVDAIAGYAAEPPLASPSPFVADSFGALLMDGMRNVDHSLRTAEAASTAFALGDDRPPHQVVLALEDARLKLQFALNVRARLVEGYQELMRMQL